MPVKPRSVTGADTNRIRLGKVKQKSLRILLTKRKLPKEAAEGFVREVNGAIVAAYDLWPVQSSPKEEFAWLERVQEKAEELRAALAVVDDLPSHIILDNEHLDAFGGRPLDDHLKSVIAYCKERTKDKPKPMRRGRTPQGTLAEDLARLWRKYFDNLPTFNCWEGARPTPFMEALGLILGEIEPDENYNDAALGKITERALADLHKQDEVEARSLSDR